MESFRMDTSEDNRMNSETRSELPAWRMPISTNFSSTLRDRILSVDENSMSEDHKKAYHSLYNNANAGTLGERAIQYDDTNNRNINKINSISSENRPVVSRTSSNKSEGGEEEDSQSVIQILLPCIVCNRTFSPEALERHSKICTKVNIKSPYKPTRGTFDITEKRKKGTKLEDFIPPPPTFDALTDNRFGFSRGSRNRASLRGTSCTTRSTLNSSSGQRRERSQSQSRERSSSTTRASSIAPPLPPSSSMNSQNEYPYDDTSEFGSNNSEENTPGNLPSYAKPIAPTDLCPYCHRSFGIKSFDRHVEFCKELYERKRYEIQPTPKEKEEAMERQELRTKYRPMKSSSSCTSLRSMSPAKDFASMAMKLFGGLRRTEGTSNLYFNQIKNNLKKSNESIANSCYGDYTRGLRRTSPSPVRPAGMSPAASNKLNNMFTKSYLQQQQQQQQQQLYNYPNHQQSSLLPMRINTSSNIPKMTKSSDSLIASNNYAHVPSSGYGQAPAALLINTNNNNFSRNSRSRSSLHKNFFRTKRAEPDGTENTSLSQSPTATSPLIITPMNFYSKSTKPSSVSALDLSDNINKNQTKLGLGSATEQLRGMSMLTENARPSGTLLTSDPDYDPYEKAAKQLEELLKTNPVKSSKRSSRRTGLAKAFESVGVPSDMVSLGKSKIGRTQSLDYNSDPFGLGSGSGGAFRTRTTDPFGIGGMSMTPNIDDSYWDEILRKGDNQNSNSSNHNNNNQETASSQGESDTSGASDTAKSRAMSNTSSADSAFSRSEVNDPEFEALESIANLGDRSRYRKTNHKEGTKSVDYFNSASKLLESNHRSVPRSASVDQGRIPMDSLHATDDSRQSSAADSSSNSGNVGGLAKFCFECGTPYPTILAKFCSECGEKRVFKV